MHLTACAACRAECSVSGEHRVRPLNLTSTIGAFSLPPVSGYLLGSARPKGKQPHLATQPLESGTLEWLQEMPGKPWGVRSIPEVDSRYPSGTQPNFERDVTKDAFTCPRRGAEAETIVTSVLDARRRHASGAGTLMGAVVSAVFVGGFFVRDVSLGMLALGA